MQVQFGKSHQQICERPKHSTSPEVETKLGALWHELLVDQVTISNPKVLKDGRVTAQASFKDDSDKYQVTLYGDSREAEAMKAEWLDNLDSKEGFDEEKWTNVLPHGFTIKHYKSGNSLTYSADSPFQSTDHLAFSKTNEKGSMQAWFTSNMARRLARQIESIFQNKVEQALFPHA